MYYVSDCTCTAPVNMHPVDRFACFCIALEIAWFLMHSRI